MTVKALEKNKRKQKRGNDFLSYEDAKNYVRTLGLKNHREWNQYCKSGNKPDNIPNGANRAYKNQGWVNWADFLGTNNISVKNRKYLPFNEARGYVRNLKFKNRDEWREYSKSDKRPNNIPSDPGRTYKNSGWINLADFLGSNNVSNKNRIFLSYINAKEYVHTLGIKNNMEWREYWKINKKPDNIPNMPDRTYKNNGWVSWGDWLGTNRIANQNKEFVSFEEAREFARKLGLKSHEEWIQYCKSGKKPKNIPNDPHDVYVNKRSNAIDDDKRRK